MLVPHAAHEQRSDRFLPHLVMLLITIIGVVPLSLFAAGCGDGTRHVRLEDRLGTGVSLSQL